MNRNRIRQVIDENLSSLRITERNVSEIIRLAREGKKVKKVSFAFVLSMALVLMTVTALAATLLARDVFTMTMGHAPENAKSLTQYDLGTYQVGDAEIAIREAAYDGMSLYIAYSVRAPKIDHLLGTASDKGEIRSLKDEELAHFDSLGAGFWADTIWIDGIDVGAPTGTVGIQIGGEEPGEAIFYSQYRLDRIGMYLTGENVEIALPLGEKPKNTSDYYDAENDVYRKPETGVIAFTMDCSVRDQVITETPCIETKGKYWDAKVTEVVYSPIQMYVTVDWAVHKDVMDKFIAENGEGFIVDGVKYWDYTAIDACDDMGRLVLVDGEGNKVFDAFDGFYGCEVYGPTQAHYVFPYRAEYPDTMYLAPEREGIIDMADAIALRKW